jgi:hypothetical protein
MTQHVPILLVGNALSSMVAATRLAQGGAQVTIVNSSNNWGGHFTTMTCKGVDFDPGMVLDEFTSYKASSPDEDIRTYDPLIRNDAGRFCESVRHCVGRYQELRDIAVPKMYVDGVIYDDILIANALWSLPQLPFHDAITNELLALLERSSASPLHACRKYSSGEFKELDYQKASLANHGATLHAKLIEPYCWKVLNVSTAEVIALYHRVPWLPLFYPETLVSYLRGSPQELPPTTFSYPYHGHVGGFAKQLQSELEGNDRVTIIPHKVATVSAVRNGGYELELLNGARILTNHLAWSNNLSDLLRVLGIEVPASSYQKCSIAIAFLRIPTAALMLDFTVLNVVAPEIGTYRITNQSACAGAQSAFANLVAELNPDYVAGWPANRVQAALTSVVIEDLVKLGIVSEPAHVDCLDLKQLKNALMLPSSSNRHNAMQEFDAATAAAPSIALLGPASGFFSSSFNDHVVQGLKLAATWGHAP